MLRIPHCGACSTPTAPCSPSCTRQNSCCRVNFLPFPYKSKIPIPLFSSPAADHFQTHRRSDPLLSCKASLGNADGSPGSLDGGDDSDQFLEASFLLSETVRHYNFWKQGFVEETKWHSPAQKRSFSHGKGEKSDVSSIGHGFLRRFQSPTIFLKISCDGDLLLPIIVGEIAIDELIDALRDDQHEECPDQYNFVQNILEKSGFEVKLVRITERVVNTYRAHILLGKRTERHSISIDARPSDAINVAIRLKAPIYVSKEIVLKDAIKIIYGRWRGSRLKTVYDVSLDSAVDGPDPLAEELELVRNMNVAVLEERYEDAAFWKDKLKKLCQT